MAITGGRVALMLSLKKARKADGVVYPGQGITGGDRPLQHVDTGRDMNSKERRGSEGSILAR